MLSAVVKVMSGSGRDAPRALPKRDASDQLLITPQGQLSLRRFASKSMSSAVRGKVGAVRLAQAPEGRRCLDGESLAGDGAEQWAGERSAVIGEAD